MSLSGFTTKVPARAERPGFGSPTPTLKIQAWQHMPVTLVDRVGGQTDPQHLLTSQSSRLVSSGLSKRHCLNREDENSGRFPILTSGHHTHMCTHAVSACVCQCAYTHNYKIKFKRKFKRDKKILFFHIIQILISKSGDQKFPTLFHYMFIICLFVFETGSCYLALTDLTLTMQARLT